MGVSKPDEGDLHRSLFNLASDCIFLLEPQSGGAIIADANEAACSMHGYTKEELIGKPISFLDHPEDVGQIPGRIQALLRGERVSFEIRHVRKDGSVFPMEVSAQTIVIGGKTYIQAIDRDITERKAAEEKLKLFSNALEQSMDGIQLVDLDGRVIYSNKAVEAIYGYSPEELNGRHVNEMNVDAEFAGREIIPAIKKTGRWSGELMVRHKNGGAFPVWLSASIVMDDGGRPIAMVGGIRDMTERKKALEEKVWQEQVLQRHIKKIEDYTLSLQVKQEELEFAMRELKESEAKYQDLFENANDIIFTLDRAGKFTSLNYAAITGFGYRSREELEGRRFFEVLTAESYETAEEFINEAIRRKDPLLEWQPLDLIAVRKGQRHFNIELRARLLMDGGDAVTGLQVIARDITVRKEMEKTLVEIVGELREEKNFSESVIGSLSSGLMVTNPEGKILSINPAGKRILGGFSQSDGDMEGKRLQEVIGYSAFHDIIGEGGLQRKTHGEAALKSSGGAQKIIGFTTVERRDASVAGSPGAAQGVIVLFMDITESRAIEKEMERINRLSTVAEIASAVAHEVRNPLAGIKTMAQSIAENITGQDPNREYVVRILRQVDRLNGILKEFFDYARPSKPKTQEASLTDIIKEIIPLVKVKLEKKDISVVENYGEGLPLILVDPNQMQQVFLNLFLNAIEAVGYGGQIKISALKLDGDVRETFAAYSPSLRDDTDYAVIRFGDNGPGMTKEVAEKIFEPFFTTKASGTGLGLSIVYRILKENDSAIFVESAAGRGTLFTIFCPCGAPSHGGATGPSVTGHGVQTAE